MKEEQRILKYNRENPECPYCRKDNFDNPLEEGIHRAKCSKAAFKENGKIPAKPSHKTTAKNKVNEYRQNNKRPGKENRGEKQGTYL